YRVGTPPDSHICMVLAKEQKSDEIGKAEAPSELPFVNVHRYLSGLGVRVPNIVRYDIDAGVMVIEDLTDLTFEKALQSGESAESLYGRAVELLAQLRAKAEKAPQGDCIAFSRHFDEDLY